MELLKTAVVDIAMLVSTCHALSSEAFDIELALHPKTRRRLHREIHRAALAYTDRLARARRSGIDDALLAACRSAAEKAMPGAVAQQDLLARMLAREPGALEGLAAARQDLWRLAHLVICLRSGLAALQAGAGTADLATAERRGTRLRRSLRAAMIAYTQETLRTRQAPQGRIAAARDAAWAEIGKRGRRDSTRLAEIETSSLAEDGMLQLGVARPLRDLGLDWRPQPAAAEG